MATYDVSIAETVFATDSVEAEVLASVTKAIEALTQDEVRALKAALASLHPAAPEGEHRSGATHVTGTGKLTATGFATVKGATISADQARAQIVQAVPKIEPLFPTLEAKVPGITGGLIILVLTLVLQPADKGSSEYALFRRTINNITIVAPPSSSPTLSPLAQVVLAELRKMGGAVLRESVLAATTLSPEDVDRGLSELVQAGIITEPAPGVFAPR